MAKQNQPKHHAAKSKTAVQARRKKIIKALISGKTQQQAGVDAGLNPKNACSQVTNILKEPQTQATFRALLDKYIPDDELAAKYKELSNAKKVISAMVIGDGGMKDANSMTRDFVEVDDCAVQLKCVDSVSKLKGYLTEKHDVNLGGSMIAEVVAARMAQKGAGNDKGKGENSALKRK
jgi:isocitrate lyase